MSINRWSKENQKLETLVPSTEPKEYYSTEETLTNKVWIDGKPIYSKVLEVELDSPIVGRLTNTISLPNSIVVNAYGYVTYEKASEKVYIFINSSNYKGDDTQTNFMSVYTSGSITKGQFLLIQYSKEIPSWARETTKITAYVCIEYTKTTD